jgi:hypothetical protein
MVFLAITKNGLNDALRTAAEIDAAVWCGVDAISEGDYSNRQHKNLSRFDYELGNRDGAALADAIQTINEHHPGEVVWIEGANAG